MDPNCTVDAEALNVTGLPAVGEPLVVNDAYPRLIRSEGNAGKGSDLMANVVPGVLAATVIGVSVVELVVCDVGRGAVGRKTPRLAGRRPR